MPTCSFIPKYRRFPFFDRCISGPRALLSFPVGDGAEMMVASTMPPSFSRTSPVDQVIPNLPNSRRSSQRQKSGPSSRPEPSPASPRQGAEQEN